MEPQPDLGTNAYLIFEIEDEQFAAEVEKVVRIAELPEITQVPKAPEFLQGVINQRGTVIPLINTKYKFGVQASGTEEYQVIVLFRIQYNEEEVEIAATVSAVRDVLSAEDVSLSPAPEMGLRYKPDYVKGMIVNKDKFVILLDIDKVLTTDEIIRLNQTVSTK